MTELDINSIVNKIDELTQPGEYLDYLFPYCVGEKIKYLLQQQLDGPVVISTPSGWINVVIDEDKNSIGILSKKADDPDWTFREFSLFIPPIDLRPFDMVLYKPKNQEGLVKSVTDHGVFVLFRIQSTAELCRFEDLEKI